MRSTTRMWALVVASSAVMGCKDSSVTRALLDAQNDATRVECECFYADDGYSSADECTEDNTFPVVSRAVSCGDRAVAADRSGQIRAAMECLVEKTETRNACFRASGCDLDAIDACEDDFVFALAECPVPDASAEAAFDAALADCIGGGGGGDDPDFDVCPESSLGSVTGDAVASGTTVGGDNDVAGSCGGSNANDAGFAWVAPSTGTVTFTTTGSDLDTVLHVHEGNSCAGVELACDDDGGEVWDSSITLSVTEGDALVIVVDAFASDAGSYVLNIHYEAAAL